MNRRQLFAGLGAALVAPRLSAVSGLAPLESAPGFMKAWPLATTALCASGFINQGTMVTYTGTASNEGPAYVS